MSYPAMNKDIILEILSYCPVSAIEKFRFLNKDYYKLISESSFINLNLRRTKSVFGVFLQYQGYHSAFYSSYVLTSENIHRRSNLSLDFLPLEKVKIEACDPSHGILLCVDSKRYGRNPYMVCKPTTKQFQTIPNPETGCSRTIITGLMVIRANPLRYKIVKLSQEMKIENDNCYTLLCEVFDSDLFAWKRLEDDVKLPKGEFLRISSVPISANGFLHWLTTSNKNVFRFCMKTSTWSLLPLPNDDLAKGSPLILAKYEGKLCIMLWKAKSGESLKGFWMLHSSFGKTWVNVKEEKSIVEEDKLVRPVWLLPRTNVAMMCGFDWVGLYDMETKRMKSERYKISLPSTFGFDSSFNYFPFYSDYEKLNLNEVLMQ
ncbi:hypothetical protein CARUB_v10006367mg [Capsella rubella]|uniref:F-box associated beta-propeller type 3 domain-containing protein n=1 Tax=Capsella rubella TaxID=81985 RepID=R0F8K5_9BRAS|nr:uncharacterized protein LOC17880177 [Capsella rubella]EOA17956.1 hypothetical protein CARUB_v10006367mg [Capsella rubella]